MRGDQGGVDNRMRGRKNRGKSRIDNKGEKSGVVRVFMEVGNIERGDRKLTWQRSKVAQIRDTFEGEKDKKATEKTEITGRDSNKTVS